MDTHSFSLSVTSLTHFDFPDSCIFMLCASWLWFFRGLFHPGSDIFSKPFAFFNIFFM
jgi:hypothetical protein